MEKRILLLEKVTNLEHYQASKFKKSCKNIANKLTKEHVEHNKFVGEVENIFISKKINYDKNKISDIKKINFNNYDLIITAGGDGTFLQAAEKISNQFIIGLNSVYTESNRGSIGGLTIINKENLYKIERIFTKDYSIQKWKRLYTKINDQLLNNLAVNDIYVGHSKAYMTSHLKVTIKPESECFLSSGIIISTGMGSHAWFRSAGGSQFKNELDIFGMIVREPFEKKKKYKFTSKILADKEEITISPNRDGHVIVFDSDGKEYLISMEDYVTIGLSDRSLNVINFD